MLQIADGGAQTISGVLDRMKELAAQAASDNVGSERAKLQDEFNSLRSEIGRILDSTQYQGTNVLTALGSSVSYSVTAGQAAAGLTSAGLGGQVTAQNYTIAQVTGSPGLITITAASGASETIAAVDGAQILTFAGLGLTLSTNAAFTTSTGAAAGSLDAEVILPVASGTGKTILVGASGQYATNDTISLDLGSLESVRTALAGQDLLSLANGQTALAAIDTAISNANSFVGKLGAAESRIEYAQQNLASIAQNTAAAESTIRDADMAAEMSEFTKNQILQQAGTAMLAQANSAPQLVLRLLQ
jgi:flagellin